MKRMNLIQKIIIIIINIPIEIMRLYNNEEIWKKREKKEKKKKKIRRMRK
jgi:hypothetical protein